MGLRDVLAVLFRKPVANTPDLDVAKDQLAEMRERREAIVAARVRGQARRASDRVGGR